MRFGGGKFNVDHSLRGLTLLIHCYRQRVVWERRALNRGKALAFEFPARIDLRKSPLFDGRVPYQFPGALRSVEIPAIDRNAGRRYGVKLGVPRNVMPEFDQLRVIRDVALSLNRKSIGFLNRKSIVT